MTKKMLALKNLEHKYEKIGRIKKYDFSELNQEVDIWYVWYKEKKKTKDKPSIRIIPGTGSFEKEGARLQQKKLFKSGAFYGYKHGLVRTKAFLSDFVFTKNPSNDDIHDIKNQLSKTGYIVLDTETTGFSKNDEVIDLGAYKILEGKAVDKFQSYIIPTVPIQDRSIQVHGLSKSFLTKNGSNASSSFAKFIGFIEGLPIVGYNVKFDIRLIQQHSQKFNLNIDLEFGFDVQKIVEKIIEFPEYKLESIARFLEINNNINFHGAIDDVEVTFRLIKKIEEIIKEYY